MLARTSMSPSIIKEPLSESQVVPALLDHAHLLFPTQILSTCSRQPSYVAAVSVTCPSTVSRPSHPLSSSCAAAAAVAAVVFVGVAVVVTVFVVVLVGRSGGGCGVPEQVSVLFGCMQSVTRSRAAGGPPVAGSFAVAVIMA